jgi:HEAT repeat protein
MFSFKRFSILFVTAVIVISTVTAQQRREMTPEQSYLQESIELMIIRETARAENREQKLIALEYIGEALNRGSTNDEIRQTLEYLSREGVMSNARENGRLVNNFPDIRRQSAKYLAQIGTEEARKTLIDILQYEKYPTVLQEMIKALGDIGSNPNNETVNNIAWSVDRLLNIGQADDLVALAAIDAFEKIARKNNGINSEAAIRTLMRIEDRTSPYVTPIKERARQLLAELRTYGR